MGNARNHWKSSKTSVATCKRGRGLSEPAPTKCTIQKFPFWDFMDGMKLSVPQGSVYLVSISFFLLLLFFPSSVFFSLQGLFLSLFFLPAPDPKFFVGSSYLLQPPTALLPTNPPTSLFLLAPSPTHLLLLSLP
jgi:hypothetical protein